MAFCIFLSVKAGLDVICSVLQGNYLVLKTEQKADFFFTCYSFVGKPDLRSANLTSKVIFFNEILRVTTGMNACELTE